MRHAAWMPRKPLPSAISAQPFSTQDARGLGVGRGRLRGSDLIQPFRGVHLPRGVPPTLINRCLALQTRLPPYAFFSGVTAALVMGIPLPSAFEIDPRVHVSVPRPRVAPQGRMVVGHVSSSAGFRYWRGVRVSPPERVWCELGRDLRLADLVAAGDFLIHRELPITNAAGLALEVDGWGRRAGCAVLRNALPLLSDRSESPRESILRVLLVGAGIAGLVPNLPIRTSGGYDYRADLAFPDQKVIVEYQSRFHDNSASFTDDMTRKSRLEADGWHVIEVNARDLDDPAELIARIRRVLARRASAHG